jgi:hypothetical protein
MVGQLVVLHEGAVDYRHAKVHVEHDRHRLELANHDVAEDTDKGKDPLGMSCPAGQLTAETLPLFEQPLVGGLKHHAAHANGMQQDEQSHPRSAEALIDREPLAGRDGECDSLRIAVEKVDVARSASERAG